MLSRAARQSLVWGALLVVVGAMALVGQFYMLSPWLWVGILAAAGLGALGLWWTDRSAGWLLPVAYILCTIALLIGLVVPSLLRDEAVALYVLAAIALPFVAAFLRDRAQWWALIPAYTLLAVAGIIGLAEMAQARDELVAAYILFAIAVPFLVLYARNRARRWALIPGGILTAISLGFLFSDAALALLGALILVALGVMILVRAFRIGREGKDEASRGDG